MSLMEIPASGRVRVAYEAALRELQTLGIEETAKAELSRSIAWEVSSAFATGPGSFPAVDFGDTGQRDLTAENTAATVLGENYDEVHPVAGSSISLAITAAWTAVAAWEDWRVSPQRYRRPGQRDALVNAGRWFGGILNEQRISEFTQGRVTFVGEYDRKKYEVAEAYFTIPDGDAVQMSLGDWIVCEEGRWFVLTDGVFRDRYVLDSVFPGSRS
ncbi:hypothetical protein [Actinoplanes derwentensis]|uniref:Uncharacterized protein n=1 Tax=Actinoplanes derwentensis TaxID=113562 RepID=A0A1H2DCH9_9ACTN|nr:hypothetical protein [Actinoplanes derwentensis]GID90413.1 hypothetical protein Ade03nite_93370 [Actinoplanes derwentensis]SDT80458.1 hypothetical protein SAMN04489716_9212 [Actinoplanes derwentensis]